MAAKNRTDTVFLPISEVCNVTVSLEEISLRPELSIFKIQGGPLSVTDNVQNSDEERKFFCLILY